VLVPLVVVVAVVLSWWRPWQPRIVIHQRINPKDGAVMVWVPAGTFRMGISMGDELRAAVGQRNWLAMRDVVWRELHIEANSIQVPSHTVYLDGYWSYKYEVTVAQYRQFCLATKRAMPKKPRWGWQDDYPIVNVSWHDAATYAAWAGASLPTEAQWEKAARGPDGRIYPWGDTWDVSRCCNSVLFLAGSQSRIHFPAQSPSPIGSFPTGASPYGAQDMAGNVYEWCSDWYDDNNQHAPQRNPTGPTTGTVRVMRGGAWSYIAPDFFRCNSQNRYEPKRSSDDFGFRCVLTSPGP